MVWGAWLRSEAIATAGGKTTKRSQDNYVGGNTSKEYLAWLFHYHHYSKTVCGYGKALIPFIMLEVVKIRSCPRPFGAGWQSLSHRDR